MIEVYCKLIKTIKIEKTDYYVFFNIENKEENLIPCNIIDEFVDVDFTKPQLFLRENINGKIFIRFIHPDYKIGNIIRLPIIERFENKYLLESKYFKQLTVDSFIWQKDFYDVECKIVGYKGNKPVLRNIDTRNSKWKINENYILKILDYSSIFNKKDEKINTIVVDCTGTPVNVIASDWHSKELWKHNDIECKVIGISKDGTPKLLINDSRHPVFKIGKEYSFKIIDLIVKKLKSGTNIKVFKLKGLDGLIYEIQAFTDLEEKFKIGDEIECEVSGINTTVYLRHIFKKDQYFYDFENIVKSSMGYEKFFKPCIEDENPIFNKLKEQYFSKSGFWVFTYCNQIIPYIKKNLTDRRNLSELINLLEVLTTLEKWILQKGILKAFENELERKITKTKIEKILIQSSTEINSIKKFLDFKESDLLNGTLEEVLYYIKYSNVENLDYQKLIYYFTSYNFSEKDELVLLKTIEYTLNSYRKQNRIITDNNYFIVNRDSKYSPKKINSLCLLLYSQIIINNILNNIERVNFLKSKFYRIYSYSSKDKDLKKTLLLNSFFLLNNLDEENELFFYLKENNIHLDTNKVIDNPNLLETFFDEKKSFHLAKILKRNNHGFDIIIDNIKGFLPIQNVYDNELKKKGIENLDWDTNVEITAFSKEFNFFISKQLDIDSTNYLSKNNKENLTPDFKIKYYGKIKNITDYGIFITTEFGDGLIHKSQIATHFIDEFFLNLHFKVGQILPFYFIYFKENKLELSLLKLNENGFYEEYEELFSFGELAIYDFSNGKFENNNDSSLSNNIEIDKAYVLESYANLLFDLNQKIDILKLSKALYSNTKNSRSYLINIYIDYFHSLINLDSLLDNYSIEKYEKFRESILEIKDRINQKTLESYPEAKNLSFFVDLLSLFNKTDDNDLESLFNLTKLPLEENNQLLKVVSKTVLANNLILSETEIKNYEDVNKFTLKNLRRIRQFISQGILSLEETVDDIRESELEMTRLYWKKRIEEDEGEDLEFKSTLLTPIPNREKIKIISGLKEKLVNEKSEEKIKRLTSKIKELNDSETNDKFLEKKIIHSALKTICAFANTNGGTLLLGVSDDKKIFGLELDYQKVNKKIANRDEFGKRFDEILKDYFGNSFSSSQLKKEFLKFPEGDILIVNVSKSLEEVFLLKDENGNKKESLYIRNLSSSERLDGIELAKFIKKRHLTFMNLKVEL